MSSLLGTEIQQFIGFSKLGMSKRPAPYKFCYFARRCILWKPTIIVLLTQSAVLAISLAPKRVDCTFPPLPGFFWGVGKGCSPPCPLLRTILSISSATRSTLRSSVVYLSKREMTNLAPQGLSFQFHQFEFRKVVSRGWTSITFDFVSRGLK